MTTMVRFACLLSLGACLTPACGGATSGPKPFSSGLPATKQLGSLDDHDASQLCDALVSYIEGWTDSPFCKVNGLTAAHAKIVLSSQGAPSDSELQSACSATTSKCEAKRGQGGGTCKLKKEDLACDGTVSEFEACVDE